MLEAALRGSQRALRWSSSVGGELDTLPGPGGESDRGRKRTPDGNDNHSSNETLQSNDPSADNVADTNSRNSDEHTFKNPNYMIIPLHLFI